MVKYIVTKLKTVLGEMKGFDKLECSDNKISFNCIDDQRYSIEVSSSVKENITIPEGAHVYAPRRRYITAIQYNGHNFDEVSKLYCGCHIVEYFDGRTSPELILTDNDINKFIAVCGIKCYVIPLDVFYKEYELVEY